MQTRNLKVAALAIAAIILGSICWRNGNAQGTSNGSKISELSTNWVGFGVFGREDSVDRIGRGAYPAVDAQVQIGLRSDGLVVWRTGPAPHQRKEGFFANDRAANPTRQASPAALGAFFQ